MEAGEAFAAALAKTDEKVKCQYKKPKDEWKCVLGGDSGHLETNIKRDRGKAKPETPASLAQVTKSRWPSQAHHLIPHVQLSGHVVTEWIAESKDALLGDCNYSVNHGLNGKFMPYASSLSDWKSASTEKKVKIANKVMKAAGIQLHQGAHSYEPYNENQDGYKTRVEEYLEKVKDQSVGHYDPETGCEECRETTNGKVPPRRNTVSMLDRASKQLDKDIRKGEIAVSRRASDYVANVGPLGG
jgi:hypothetical protein